MHIEGVCVPGTGRERRGEVLQGKKDQYEVEMEIYNILTTQANNRSRLYMAISAISAFGFTSVKKPLSPHFTLSSSFRTVQTRRTI
jgi:hypothetical protein